MNNNNEYPECDCFKDHRRAICRGEEPNRPLDGPNSVNAYRKKWGLPPLLIKPLSGIQRAFSFVKVAANSVGRALRRKPVLVDEAVVKSRLESCNACSYFSQGKCLMCKCSCNASSQFMNKLAHASSSCPIGRWKEVK